jgi:7-carboxy-7-deazaguanine synthase
MKAKISEIFSSIQGEGKYTGYAQVFVRFFGCNINCAWCDTPKASGRAKSRQLEYSPRELFAHVKKLYKNCPSVSLPGGEPLLQSAFLKEFLPLLKKAGMTVYLETNGILPRQLKEVIGRVDIVSMDIKLPSSAKCPSFWQEHENFLKISSRRDVFVKAVISHDTTRADVVRAAKLIQKVDPKIGLFLQPNSFEMSNGTLKKCAKFQKDCCRYLEHVRVLPQMHKLLNLK